MSTHTQELGWVPRDDTFASRLAMIRHRMGWNAKEAALACGLPQNSWRDWEFTSRRPRDYLDVCQRVAERTGVSLYWLMTGRPEPGPGGGGTVTPAYLSRRPAPLTSTGAAHSSQSTITPLRRAA